jgi:hypothetical protein
MVPFRTLSEVTIKMAYLADIFNVSHFAVTVTANDILRIEIKRYSTSVRVGFIYLSTPPSDIKNNGYHL